LLHKILLYSPDSRIILYVILVFEWYMWIYYLLRFYITRAIRRSPEPLGEGDILPWQVIYPHISLQNQNNNFITIPLPNLDDFLKNHCCFKWNVQIRFPLGYPFITTWHINTWRIFPVPTECKQEKRSSLLNALFCN
jgi:hypothetical protein